MQSIWYTWKYRHKIHNLHLVVTVAGRPASLKSIFTSVIPSLNIGSDLDTTMYDCVCVCGTPSWKEDIAYFGNRLFSHVYRSSPFFFFLFCHDGFLFTFLGSLRSLHQIWSTCMRHHHHKPLWPSQRDSSRPNRCLSLCWSVVYMFVQRPGV